MAGKMTALLVMVGQAKKGREGEGDEGDERGGGGIQMQVQRETARVCQTLLGRCRRRRGPPRGEDPVSVCC